MKQRELKFRVWDSTKSKFISYGSDLYNICYEYESGLLSFGDDTMIQQYTGLKDKNGKEIYEGDIVVWPESVLDDDIPNPYSRSDKGQYNYNIRKSPKQVVWSHYMRFALEDIPRDGSLTYSFNQYCEIIGNIFENPELLNNE